MLKPQSAASNKHHDAYARLTVFEPCRPAGLPCLFALPVCPAVRACCAPVQRNAMSYFNFLNDEGRQVVGALLPSAYGQGS